MIRALAFAAAATAATSPARVASPPVLPISGALVRAAALLDANGWSRLPHVQVEATDHDGTRAEYGGVRLADALHDAGAPVGDAVRGSAARAYVLVGASDGYGAIFTLAELDQTEARCAPLLADVRDGEPLAADAGPVRIVAPCDRTHARWVRGVTRFTVVVTPAGPTP